ncbi:IS200/IS605 family transposase [Candidatus Pacearchaeota archaeon]|nr:IS200/IS605 family transposase [Candidatus Pacearchaeota archaeon]
METKIIEYKHYENSVGNNLQVIQITTKCRYAMMQKEIIETYCRIAIEEACKKHKIEIVIIEVLKEHVHIIVNCPRTLSQAEMMQIIKGLSAYIIFRLCPNLRKRYPKGHFWSEGYFCEGCGSDFERALSYVQNQKQHHFFS